MPAPNETRSDSIPESTTRFPQDWDTCLDMARRLEQPPERTEAIAQVLFGVWQDVRRFEDLDLDGVEPAVQFLASWRQER